MGKVQYCSRAGRSNSRFDPMALIEEDIGSVLGEMSSYDIGYPSELLIGDDHEPRIAGKRQYANENISMMLQILLLRISNNVM